jgi:hypothetical protein
VKTPLVEVFSSSPATAPEKKLLPVNGARKVADGVRLMWEQTVLVRGEKPARWEPQEEGMMSIAASFPSVKKPRFNIGQERRGKRLKVMQTGLVTLQQGRR